MTNFFNIQTKTTHLIRILTELTNYKLCNDRTIYESNTDVTSLVQNNCIVVIKRKGSTEVIVPDNIIPDLRIDTDNPALLTKLDTNDDPSNSQERALASVVLESLKKSGIDNQPLMAELERQVEDPIEGRNIEIEHTFILERK